LRFRSGKGARLCGPFSVHTVVPLTVAQRLAEHIAAHAADGPDVPLFSTGDQAALALLVKEYKNCSLRSLRKGSLVLAANHGVNDDNLMLLSGHQSRATLLRYLGWGRHSASAKQAARRVADALNEPSGAAPWQPEDLTALFKSEPKSDVPAQPTPLSNARLLEMKRNVPKMGQYSGQCGHKGQRIARPPNFFPLKPASRQELGLPAPDRKAYTLHVKDVTTLAWAAIKKATCPELTDLIHTAESWCATSDRFPPGSVTPSQIPRCAFTLEQRDVLLAAGKIEVCHTVPAAYAKGFGVAQDEKRRIRPVFEPLLNKLVGELIPQAYPSRLEVRQQVCGSAFSADFDFAAYFDQVEIPVEARPFFCVRFPGDETVYMLTRLPMGASWAPGAAQSITWSLTAPIVKLPHVRVATIIDNVRIVADTGEAFLLAVRMFLARADAMGVQLNDNDAWRLADDELLAKGRSHSVGPTTFLGETYLSHDGVHMVRNSEKSVTKLRDAVETLLPSPDLSRRKFAHIVGLMNFMSHTLGISLGTYESLLRASAAIATAAAEGGWDVPVALHENVVREVYALSSTLIGNKAVPIPPATPPPTGFDVTIVTDACESGWAAWVHESDTGRLREIRRGWKGAMSHSAHAEPEAATMALEWAEVNVPRFRAKTVAIVTDHDAIVGRQKRWWSGYSGFSASFYLNRFYNRFYNRDAFASREVFHIQGENNPVDAASRATTIGGRMVVEDIDAVVPVVSQLRHPYRRPPDRKWYQV
jgi:hypothetical protein